MTDPESPARLGLLHGVVDGVIDRTRTLTDLVASTSSGVLGRAPEPVPQAVRLMFDSLRQLAEQAPPVTAEIGILMDALRAQRLSIEALQVQLTALDRQLEVLEKAMGPVEAWNRSWDKLRNSLTASLEQLGQLGLPKE